MSCNNSDILLLHVEIVKTVVRSIYL